MLWCKHCQKAVPEPEERHEYDIPNADAPGYEKITTYHCPECGEEVYLEAGQCVMCGGHAAPEKDLCDSCYMLIHETLHEFAMSLNLSFDCVLDGVAEYLYMEDK